jgi:hypothetical protein
MSDLSDLRHGHDVDVCLHASAGARVANRNHVTRRHLQQVTCQLVQTSCSLRERYHGRNILIKSSYIYFVMCSSCVAAHATALSMRSVRVNKEDA